MVEVSLAQGHLYLGHPNQAQGVIDQEESDGVNKVIPDWVVYTY